MISKSYERPFLNWLGVHFSRKLNFKSYALKQASNFINETHYLRSLGNNSLIIASRGTLSGLIRQAVLSYVMPMAYFAAETWWLGKTRIKNSKIICNRVGMHFAALDKVYANAARPILSVYRKAPTQVTFRVTG